MALLVPDPRAWMLRQQPIGERRGGGRLAGVELEPTQVLGADEAVLTRAHEPDRRTVVTVERPAVEVLGDQDVVVERAR